jgi:SNF2 family DNA or RNA helicase
MIVLHALWDNGRLFVWGEDSSAVTSSSDTKPLEAKPVRARNHPYACSTQVLTATVGRSVTDENESITVDLPTTATGPAPSVTLRRFDSTAAQVKLGRKLRLFPWNVPSVALEPNESMRLLLRMAGNEQPAQSSNGDVRLDESFYFLATVAQFGLELVANGRILPALVPVADQHFARWRPILTPDDSNRCQQLLSIAPPACRAWTQTARNNEHAPPNTVRSLVETVVDTMARRSCPSLLPASRSRRSTTYLTSWLEALSSDDALVDFPDTELASLAAEIDEWRTGALGLSRKVRTCFRLVPPSDEVMQQVSNAPWVLEVLLQSVNDPSLVITAAEVWSDSKDTKLLPDIDVSAAEVLLRDLGRASRLYPEIETLLQASQPESLQLDTTQAVEFLQGAAPLLERAGFGVFMPSWWGSKRGRLNARLKTKSRSASANTSSGLLGLDGIVDYQWEVALGDDKMSAQELQQLVALKQPLVQVRGEWVMLNESDLAAALAIAKGGAAGRERMTAGDALRIGLGLQDTDLGLPVTDIEADGWLGDLLSADDQRVEEIESPQDFEADLRPYQLRGLAWLAFHDRLGLGACLADDMGLGKTAQLLALLEHEREAKETARRSTKNAPVGPTLVVCPMSVVGNWQREAERFAPKLRVHVHHGAGRMTGDNFVDTAIDVDVVITTYQLAARDRKLLEKIDWNRIVLDEAQNIKNPQATQSRAVRALPSSRRVALTGTPVENRLSELWSIMEFLNPGLLGTATAFRKTFAHPIEREQDEDAAERLRRLTGPFVLRRLKTDRSIITDLPEKLEINMYCNLTREQASLYKAVVDDMLKRIEKAEGIQRKGLVLTTMLRLKQICNHPAQFLADGSRLAGRSGKLERLDEVIDEVIADQERVLVFTQFAAMGTLLHDYLQSRLGADVAWLHGGVPKKKRDEMVERFQADDGPPVFLLSLKAGGTGLNLTAANHVVHFDRWWNPAVENQATDRAFRIGQKRNVQIRKFITVGTLEERIDQMIEQKKALAERIVGAGENWLTELSTSALRDVISLGRDAIGEN